MPKIFVSYRRSDVPYAATLIRDRLVRQFGAESVYFDVDSVPLGLDFRRHIQRAVEQCDVLLVVIGERWLELDKQGNQRLEDPEDFVRVEIETALKRGIPVIPVPVGNARIPRAADLPEAISSLAFRNASEVRPGPSFAGHMERLIKGVEVLATQADVTVPATDSPRTADADREHPVTVAERTHAAASGRVLGLRRSWLWALVPIVVLGVVVANLLITPAPPPTHALIVITSPPGAEIEVVGMGRYQRGMQLESGTYTLRIQRSGYEVQEESVRIDAQDLKVTVALKPLPVPVPYPTFSRPDLVKIPSGTFMMGSSENGEDDEKPAHEVKIAGPFYLSATETTFDQYDAFAIATERELPGDNDWGRGSRPVINVDWYGAQAYAKWLGEQTSNECRLPSEAEWEYAARAGTQSAYGLSMSEIGAHLIGKANCAGCGGKWAGKLTAPVASFAANSWGLHDMHGNVWEWVEDCWHGSYESAPSDGMAWLEENDDKCSHRVIRGGSWNDLQDNARSAYRNGIEPGFRFFSIGFRVVCSSPIN